MTELKSQQIYADLRERILSSEMVPEGRLVLRELAHRYGASDLPVREALRMLERDGLVETIPHRGARVVTLTAQQVEEIYFIRSHLESIATGLAAQRITDEDLKALEDLVELMQVAVDAKDVPRFAELNQEFHGTIVNACGNKMLADLTMDFFQRHSGSQRLIRMVPERILTSHAEHQGILAALRDRDPERASKLALWHKQSVQETVSQMVDALADHDSHSAV